MEFVLIVFTVGVGTALGFALIWFLDRFEKEPIWVLALVFLWGAVPAMLLAVTIETSASGSVSYLFGLDGSATRTFALVVVAPVVEELLKCVALVAVFIFMRQRLHGVLDGIVYGAVVALGFGAAEAVQQLSTAFCRSGFSNSTNFLIFSKLILFGLSHAAWTACAGVGFGVAWGTRRRWLSGLAILLGIGAAMTTHSIHNVIYVGATLQRTQRMADTYMVVALLFHWLVLLSLFAIIVGAWISQWRWVRGELRHEVLSGTIGEREFQQVSKWFGRLGWEFRFLAAFDLEGFFRIRKFYNLLVKLAFARRAYGLGPGEDTRRRLDDARHRVAELRAEFLKG